jgi:hypothetical protein
MKKLLILLLVFDSFAAFAQDLTGTWEGIFYTDRYNGTRRMFYYRFHLKQQGSLVWGICEGMSAVEDKKYEISKAKVSCMYPVSGEIPMNKKDTSKVLQLFRGNVVEANIPMPICESPFYFEFKYRELNNASYLAGKWYSIYAYSPRDDAAGGSLAIRKVSNEPPNFVDDYFPKLNKMMQKSFKKDSAYLVKKGLYEKLFTTQNNDIASFDSLLSQETSTVTTIVQREDVVQKVIDIDSSFIKIDLYDNGIVDDDTVSVFLNGSKIVSSRRLAASPLHMELELDDKEDNEIKLFAENLGEIPPNTALMIITVGDKRIELNLSASLTNNAVVVFRKKKGLP